MYSYAVEFLRRDKLPHNHTNNNIYDVLPTQIIIGVVRVAIYQIVELLQQKRARRGIKKLTRIADGEIIRHKRTKLNKRRERRMQADVL